ncbi:hypothetical protein PQX77_015539, partial [Marasmius sp. AFHP31]
VALITSWLGTERPKRGIFEVLIPSVNESTTSNVLPQSYTILCIPEQLSVRRVTSPEEAQDLPSNMHSS